MFQRCRYTRAAFHPVLGRVRARAAPLALTAAVLLVAPAFADSRLAGGFEQLGEMSIPFDWIVTPDGPLVVGPDDQGWRSVSSFADGIPQGHGAPLSVYPDQGLDLTHDQTGIDWGYGVRPYAEDWEVLPKRTGRGAAWLGGEGSLVRPVPPEDWRIDPRLLEELGPSSLGVENLFAEGFVPKSAWAEWSETVEMPAWPSDIGSW